MSGGSMAATLGHGRRDIVAAARAQAERLPFVGDDGLMPAVSRPQPGRSARLIYVRSFADTNIVTVQGVRHFVSDGTA